MIAALSHVPIGLALIGTCLGVAAPAFAHGGSAAITRVAAVSDDGDPWLLQLSGGLAHRTEDGFRFVCPAAVFASNIIDALSADGSVAWVATARELCRMRRDGAVERLRDRCGEFPLRLAAHGGQVYALARDSARGQFVVCVLEDAGPREIYASPEAIEDLASDGAQLWLLRLQQEGGRDSLELASLTPESAGEWRRFELPDATRAVRGSAVSGTLFVRAIGFGREHLLRMTSRGLEPIFESASTIGPVESAGGMFAAVDGVLVAFQGSHAAVAEPQTAVDGVGGVGGYGFAWTRGAIFRLPWSSNEPLFELEQLNAAPWIEGDACLLQGRQFESELHGADHTFADSEVAVPDAGVGRRRSPRASAQPGASCAWSHPPAERPLQPWAALGMGFVAAWAWLRVRARRGRVRSSR